MCNSLLKELRFSIGEQYELNEFNLKSLESTFNNDLECENYEYIKDDFKELFGMELSSNIVLQYNGDILIGIIYEFNLESLPFLLDGLKPFLSSELIVNQENHVLGKTFVIFQNPEIHITLDVQRVIQLRVIKVLG